MNSEYVPCMLYIDMHWMALVGHIKRKETKLKCRSKHVTIRAATNLMFNHVNSSYK